MVCSNSESCGPAVPPFASKRHASLASEFVLSTVPLADGLGLALDVMVLLPEADAVGERLEIEEGDADTVDDVLALCPGVRLAVRVIVLLPVLLVLAIDVGDCAEDGDTEPAADGVVVFGDVVFVCSLRAVSARRPQALSMLARDIESPLPTLLLSLLAEGDAHGHADGEAGGGAMALAVPDGVAACDPVTLALAPLVRLAVAVWEPVTAALGVCENEPVSIAAWSARAPGCVTDGMTTVTNMTALHESAVHELLA